MLEGKIAQELLGATHNESGGWNSFILMQEGLVYTKSSAAILLFTQLGWAWKWMLLGWMIPKKLRDLLYDFVATNRYKWFGREESCMMPNKEWEGRFLD